MENLTACPIVLIQVEDDTTIPVAVNESQAYYAYLVAGLRWRGITALANTVRARRPSATGALSRARPPQLCYPDPDECERAAIPTAILAVEMPYWAPPALAFALVSGASIVCQYVPDAQSADTPVLPHRPYDRNGDVLWCAECKHGAEMRWRFVDSWVPVRAAASHLQATLTWKASRTRRLTRPSLLLRWPEFSRRTHHSVFTWRLVVCALSACLCHCGIFLCV